MGVTTRYRTAGDEAISGLPWTLVTINESIKELMKTYVEYPPRKLQSEIYTGPITLPQNRRFQHVRESLKKEGFTLPLPTGN